MMNTKIKLVTASGEEGRRQDLEAESTEAASKVPIILNLIKWMVDTQVSFYSSTLNCKCVFKILFGMYVFYINYCT